MDSAQEKGEGKKGGARGKGGEKNLRKVRAFKGEEKKGSVRGKGEEKKVAEGAGKRKRKKGMADCQ